ncbi:MAG TPA: 4Fe-4S binding protein [Planctomycetota bacterium]|nr:4Fe-4S binding protein [Planctomycetota bacterium]
MIRRVVQSIAALVFNPWLPNFLTGKLYTGKLKNACVPVLNCHSCPAATGACPIGGLQAAIGAKPFNWITLHVVGLLGVIGAVSGRFACGWLCPFGYIQDGLHKIPSPKLRVPRVLEWGKYAVLVVLVIALPALWVDEFGYSTGPWFCKVLCPAGTLEGAVPLLTAGAERIPAKPYYLILKTAILVVFLGWMVVSKRPFCRVACPLGAVYGLLNRHSLLRMRVDEAKCIRCNLCQKTCPVDLRVYERANPAECVRCLSCQKSCPKQAVSFGP